MSEIGVLTRALIFSRKMQSALWKGGGFTMVLFTILLIVLLILVAITVAAISIGGAGIIILFGDVIVCILVIIWIMKRLINKRK